MQSAFQGIESGESLVPTWAVPDGAGSFILRLAEISGRRGTARIQLAKGYIASAVDLLGRSYDKKVRNGRFEYKPYEIVSLRIRKG